VFIGVRMGDIFALAKEHIDLPPGEIETLLQSPVHEVRAGALSVMDKQARRERTPGIRRQELHDLYLRRIDRIDNWDLVDVIRNPDEQWVHGGHGADNRIDQIRVGQASFTVDPGPPVRNPVPSRCTRIPYELPVRRRRLPLRLQQAARHPVHAGAFRKPVGTPHGDRQHVVLHQAGGVDTFAIAGILLDDGEDLIHKATGGWLRAAGGVDRQQLVEFLDAHATTMPRTKLRYAIEHFEKDERDGWLRLKADARRPVP